MAEQGTVLGLDLGPNSIGWAVLKSEFENGNQVKETGLIDAGVRVFEEGVENFDTAKEKSRAQERRTTRSARRRQRRLKERKHRLKAHLQQEGLLPTDEAALKEVLSIDPYPLRAKALDERLSLVELGRVLYHLNQRRGFKSNRKQDKGDKEVGTVKEGIKETLKQIEETGARTLGEYLYRLSRTPGKDGKPVLQTGEIRLRGRYTRRDMYEHEFDAIWKAQSEFHGEVLTEPLRSKLRDEVIFFQRPYEVTEERLATMPKRANAWRSPQVRTCPFFPEEKVMERGHWLAQQFRIWKEVNTLTIYSVYHGGSRPLTEAERRCLVAALMVNKDRTFDAIRKLLNRLHMDLKDDARAPGIGDPDHEKFNLEEGGRTKLGGNTVEHVLTQVIGKKKWPKLDETEKNRLRLELSELTLNEADPEAFAKGLDRIFDDYNLDEKARLKLARFHPAESYMAYSRKAVEAILPHLEAGMNEFEAIEAAGLKRREDEQKDKLPLQPLVQGNIPNPVVNRCLFELRKVVNAIVREYGRPTYIRVEMAREMHGGKESRAERSKKMRQRQKERDEVRAEIEKQNKRPTRENILRYELWKEQDGTCPYTGAKIGRAQVFSGEIQIDHIRPRWRSLDDSRMNKVLSFAEANLEKGNKTPYEWVGDTERHDRMLQCVARMKNMPAPKKARFGEKSFPADEFVARQLNDTSYIAREAVSYLKLLYPPELRTGEKAVGATRGNLTAELRRQWGLNGLLSRVVDGKGEALKSREDHRHHAVDAVVVALSTRKHLKRYQDYWKLRDPRTDAEHDKNRPVFDPPWADRDTFRGNVDAVINNINVSHRVQGKIRGAFHEATYYGKTDDPRLFAYRKPLESLSVGEVDRIRDERIRELVFRRLKQHGWKDGDKKFPKTAFEKPLNMPSGVQVKRVRLTKVVTDPVEFRQTPDSDPFKFAKVDENHHIAFYSNEDGSKRAAMVVSMLAVADRVRRKGLPMVADVHPQQPELRLDVSLCRKESVWVSHPKTESRTLCVVTGISKGNETQPFYLQFVPISDARRASQQEAILCASWKAWDAMKVSIVRIDPLGRLF